MKHQKADASSGDGLEGVMDFDDLRIFLVTADSTSYEDAGTRLSMSAATVYKHIAKLEEETRLTLLDRSGRHIALTENGQRFYDEALHFLMLLHSAVDKARKASDRTTPDGDRDEVERKTQGTADAIRIAAHPSAISLAQLYAFTNAVETGSIRAAATRLFLSRMAVSRQLKRLEEVLGLQLLQRTNGTQGGVSATAAGMAFYRAIQKLLRDVESSLKKLRQAEQRTGESLRIAVSSVTAPLIPDELWNEIAKKLPNLSISAQPFIYQLDEFMKVSGRLGKDLDLFPCYEGSRLLEAYTFFKVGEEPLLLFAPRAEIAAKGTGKAFSLEDLAGRAIFALDPRVNFASEQLLQKIVHQVPGARVCSISFLGLNVFAEAYARGAFVLAPSSFGSLHPMMTPLTIPFHETVNYGFCYAKNPANAVKQVLDVCEHYLAEKSDGYR